MRSMLSFLLVLAAVVVTMAAKYKGGVDLDPNR